MFFHSFVHVHCMRPPWPMATLLLGLSLQRRVYREIAAPWGVSTRSSSDGTFNPKLCDVRTGGSTLSFRLENMWVAQWELDQISLWPNFARLSTLPFFSRNPGFCASCFHSPTNSTETYLYTSQYPLWLSKSTQAPFASSPVLVHATDPGMLREIRKKGRANDTCYSRHCICCQPRLWRRSQCWWW